METENRKNYKEIQLNSGSGNWLKKIGQNILSIYFIILTVIYPYYAPGGYLEIGENKYIFFRNVTLVWLAAMLLVILCTVVRRPGLLTEYFHRMSVTDWFAYGYFVAVMLSYLCSSYKEEALWGAQGWYMGTVMQMIFVLLYFYFSRYFVYRVKWVAVWLAASAGVFVLGILNRYSIYPVDMAGQTPVFISTLGNINWFCGYWSVTAPMGMALYWCSKGRWYRVAAGVYSFLAILAGIVQGSESAYLVFATAFVILLLFSIHSVQYFYRWMQLCMMFAAGCQAARLLRYLPGFWLNYGSGLNGGSPSMMERLTSGNGTLWALCIVFSGYVLLRLWIHRKDRDASGRIRNLLEDGRGNKICAAVLILCGCVGLCGLFKFGGLLYGGEEVPIMLFREDWGNGRGAAWNCSIEAYRALDALHRIVGVGPDCFAAYVYEVPAAAGRLVEEFGPERLTNAHNEGLSMLMNVGALGCMCYAGFVGSALIRFCKGARGQTFLYVCAVSLLAYTVHNMVSFQQVLSTPYFFMLLGMGEGVLRKAGKDYE